MSTHARDVQKFLNDSPSLLESSAGAFATDPDHDSRAGRSELKVSATARGLSDAYQVIEGKWLHQHQLYRRLVAHQNFRHVKRQD
jgi:hypothetical protein